MAMTAAPAMEQWGCRRTMAILIKKIVRILIRTLPRQPLFMPPTQTKYVLEVFSLSNSCHSFCSRGPPTSPRPTILLIHVQVNTFHLAAP
ncbi:hypothetical protein FRC12_017942 [Ceratobasidium sp. 428]|nr:hypothetical protein FRC12_017942 [Ceratobasidium sp. 428]